jgi:hypothetical protein
MEYKLQCLSNGGNRVTFSVIAELNSAEAKCALPQCRTFHIPAHLSFSRGGVKFSVEYRGLNISRRELPTSLSLPVQVLIRSPIAKSSDSFQCTSFSITDALSPSGAGCQSNSANIFFKAEIDSVRLEVMSQNTQMSFETPFKYTDLRRNTTNSAQQPAICSF